MYRVRQAAQRPPTLRRHTSTPPLPRDSSGTMTKLEIQGVGNAVRGKLRQQYAQLTDDNLPILEGEDVDLVGRSQEKLPVR
jgi:uncharacterized protein YjbJ (UPF0337 family)